MKSKPIKSKSLENCQITYGTGKTVFGKYLMGMKDNEICYMSFVDEPVINTSEMSSLFQNATFLKNDNLVHQKLKEYFDNVEKPSLLLTGTDFQIKVWQYLIDLPKGKTICYEEVAKGIKHPKAVRAVANAIANNKIAYFVPCHRVISKNGNLNKFKWGLERKQNMLKAEGAL